ncbi:Hypothetical protein NTJ_06665 [Nesidiocoris tenuis]|uniref:Uncharacterized protein n=1 Tax=Nesidiocoris tenuis TaxID=355587 RepID=A0ABN7ASE8_9HEMI|nr:Hypothetical protein NTJ_06665 [Nesidiocoris tenuis]
MKSSNTARVNVCEQQTIESPDSNERISSRGLLILISGERDAELVGQAVGQAEANEPPRTTNPRESSTSPGQRIRPIRESDGWRFSEMLDKTAEN